MNKEISVQYAYKKDGKGERHGDQAERMLAAQARKHNVQPTPQQMPAPLLMNGPTPLAPAAMLDGELQRGVNGTAGGYMNGRPNLPNIPYQAVPPPQLANGPGRISIPPTRSVIPGFGIPDRERERRADRI